MSFGKTTGTEVITADGAVISSGKPVRVFSVTVASGTAHGARLYNGTSTGGTLFDEINPSANTTKTQNFENGKLFSGGCYVDLLTGASSAVLECRLES